MNIFKKIALAVALPLMAMAVVSCDDDDDWVGPYPAGSIPAIVTCKTNPTTGQFYMQLNDTLTLVPTNVKESPYGNKEIRAHVIFHYADSASGHYSRSAVITAMDTIRTKPMSPVVADLDKAYGDDPVEIVNHWMTVCEDGYLTLRFRTYFGGVKTHSLHLVRTGDNTVELRHDANGDYKGELADGIIAFRLDEMPDTEGKYQTLTLKWNSFSGPKSVDFKYKSRE